MRAALLLTCLVPTMVSASARAAPVESADFSPWKEIQVAGFEDQTHDTGWIPQNSPVQMRFFLHVGNTVAIDMPGEGRYDWGAEAIGFEGSPGAGRFEYDLGVRIEAKVRFDVQGQQWESDLLGPYDWAIESVAMFTPYLLAGNPDRPAEIHDETDYVDVASVPLTPNLIVAEGTLDIALKAVVDAQLSGERIEVRDLGPSAATAVVTEEGVFVGLGPGPGPGPLDAEGRTFCTVRTMPNVVVHPHLVFTILGQDFDIAGVEVPVEVPTLDDEVMLEPVQMSFVERPTSDPEDSGGAGGTGGDGGTGGGTTGGGSTGDGSTSDTDGSGGVEADEGCGCTSPRGRNAGPSPWLAGALLLFTRRRAARR